MAGEGSKNGPKWLPWASESASAVKAVKLTSPAMLGLIGTALTVSGALIGAYITGAFDQEKAIGVQRLQVEGQLLLERQRFEAETAAAEDKLETQLILRALETTDDEEATRRLKLFAELGLIPKHKEDVLARTKEAEEHPDTRAIPSLGVQQQAPGLVPDVTPFLSDRDYYDPEADSEWRAAFYAELPNQPPSFKELAALLAGTHETGVDYQVARNELLFPTLARRRDGTNRGIYSGKVIDRSSFNAEHVVPASWFNRASPMLEDLHHLFVADVRCNRARSNFRYGDSLPAQTATVVPDCGLRFEDHIGKLFDPEANHGAVARATLYFLVRYPGAIGDALGEYGPEHLELLVRWHEDLPPTDYERRRNSYIQEVQGNRNPFIDFPEWAAQIDFTKGLATP